MSVELQRPQLNLSFARRGEVTVLDRRKFRWPFVLTRTFALDEHPRHMLTVIVQTGAGALHGEDRVAQRISVGNGAAAHVTTPGASAVHRAAPDAESRDHVSLSVEADGYLEYLPEPRILFPGSALRQSVEIDCQNRGVALIADAFTVHDPSASGRAFRRYRSSIILRCNGDLALADHSDISGLGMSASLGFTAFASVVLVAPGRLQNSVALCSELTRAFDGITKPLGAASLLPAEAGVGVRLAARELRDIREGIALIWRTSRLALCGTLPASRRKDYD